MTTHIADNECREASGHIGKAVLQFQKGLITRGEFALLVADSLATIQRHAEPDAQVLVLGNDGFTSLVQS